jgi:chaperonin GroES
VLIAKQQGHQTSGNWRIRDQGGVDSSRNRHPAESWISDFTNPSSSTGVSTAMATATQTNVRIRPLHDRVIVQRLEEGEQKVGGIIIPDSAKEKPQQGKVIAVGKGKVEKDGKVTPLDVKDGDTILFGKYSGQEIKLDGEEYLIMREEEILGVITK